MGESSPNTVLPDHGAAKKLPPKIVRQIFSNLKGPGETLDLLACSLICTSWFDEALQLVSDRLQNLYFDDHFDVEEIIRLAELLAESHHLRLPHCELITQLSISSAVLIDRSHRVSELGTFLDKAAEAYLTILRRTPNLRTLRVNTHCWLTGDYQKLYLDNHSATGQLLLFFDSVMSLCNTITGLVLHCDDRFRFDALPLHLFIPKVVYSVADHLECLETRNVAFDSETRNALALCHRMRDVDIRYTESRRVTLVLHHWEHLEKFRIYDSSSDLVSAEADRLAITLATHCPHLVEVVFQHSEEGPQMSSQAMCYLLGRCHNLTHLGATSSRLNDQFLLILASCQPHLERLILPKCEGIAGLMVTKFKDAPAWPELRQLVLDGCNSVPPEFIEKLVRDCSKLRTVALKQEYDELMVRLGFQLEDRNQDFEYCYMERNRSRFTMVWQRVETDNDGNLKQIIGDSCEVACNV